MQERELKYQILEAGKRMYEKGFVASNDGNISARIDENSLLITASGICKGDMTLDHIIKVDYNGKVLAGDLKPSSEMKMHLAVYRKRPDVLAVAHAHPRAATAFAVAGLTLDKLTLPEVIFSLGSVAFSEYGTPSTEQVPRSVEKVIDTSDAVLLANHGALTVGTTVMDAYFKMETLEHFAAITINARAIGGERVLDKSEEKELFRVRSEVFGKKGAYCTNCGECEGNKGRIHDKIPDCVLAFEKNRSGKKEDYSQLVSEIANSIAKELKMSK
jgi:L-fuculose-phosphate aldolase